MAVTSTSEIRALPISTSRLGSLLRHAAAPLVVVAIVVVTLVYVATTDLDSIEKRTLNTDYIVSRVSEHLLLTVVASALVAVLAIPVGILIHRVPGRGLRAVVLGLANIGQATPAVGVVILLAIVWKTGFATALVALVA